MPKTSKPVGALGFNRFILDDVSTFAVNKPHCA